MVLEQCRLIELPRVDDRRGSLSFIEGGNHVPFHIARVYYLYNLPIEAERGSHAHKKLEQLMIAISGNFDVVLDDGINKRTFHLDRPNRGLLISRMHWRELASFSPGAVCMVLASLPYDKDDYIRNYQEFLVAAERSRK